MDVNFDSALLAQDFDLARRRKKLTSYKAAMRCGIDPTTLRRIIKGEIKHITVNTMARMIYFIGTTDIKKYIYQGE